MRVPRDLRLRVGETAELTLPGLATAGYAWSAEADHPDVVELTWRRGFAPGDQPPPGASAAETLTIAGRRTGTVRLRLVQARRWESAGSPREQHEVEVRVEA